jgi:hypothetical protein
LPQCGFAPQTAKLLLRRKNFADMSARILDTAAEVPGTAAEVPGMAAEVPGMAAEVPGMAAEVPGMAGKPLFIKTERRTIMHYRMNANISH